MMHGCDRKYLVASVAILDLKHILKIGFRVFFKWLQHKLDIKLDMLEI